MRLGLSRESASRLGRKAAEAELYLGIHGVSVTAGVPVGPASVADRTTVEREFPVHDTPNRTDPLHKTVGLSKPVDDPITDRFDRLFARGESTMSESKPCCRNLATGVTASPFEAEIAFGYYDGPTSGILRCGGCCQEFRFEMIDQRWISEPDEVRIFELARIRNGSLEAFTSAMSAYQEPSRPIWVPHWSFPSDEDRDKMNAIVDRILDQKQPAEWVVATSGWLSGEILAARARTNPPTERPVDWFASLGLTPASIQD